MVELISYIPMYRVSCLVVSMGVQNMQLSPGSTTVVDCYREMAKKVRLGG